MFDLGGVVFPSPFDAFDAYDRANGLAPGTVRALIRTSSEEGAWAALERGELQMPDFFAALEAEALDHGFELDARRLMEGIGSRLGPRPQMVRAIERIREEGLRTAALTNNWVATDGTPTTNGLARVAFDVVVESAVEGLRKPDPRIYELTLDRLGVEAPSAVFLDDLGINLKPARAMGMTTIKVVDPDAALAELERVLGFPIS
ncbi:MAG: phosphoglycolate phosphatase [Acidimicrobiia bacterium]|nr:MAG: phosphoglycolate phosphatase [Acidimicrobiia bacterium]